MRTLVRWDGNTDPGVPRASSPLLAGALALLADRWTYRNVVAGNLVVDLGLGRRTRPLGRIGATIDAPPRDVVFETIAAPPAASPHPSRTRSR